MTEPTAPAPEVTALHLSRLAMATLTTQDFVMHADGALYSPSLLKLFEQAVAAAPKKVIVEPVAFWDWWTSEPHRLKYYADDPVYIAAREAWDAARAHPPVQPTEKK